MVASAGADTPSPRPDGGNRDVSRLKARMAARSSVSPAASSSDSSDCAPLLSAARAQPDCQSVLSKQQQQQPVARARLEPSGDGSERSPRAGSAGGGGLLKGKSSLGAGLAPILVNCLGSSSDDGSSSGGADQATGLLEARASIASTLDGGSERGAEGVPAVRIAAADVQAGRYKTGVRYCLETWPESAVLRGLDAFLAMISMFGYTATIVLILLLGSLAWATSCWPLGIFIAGIVLSVFAPAEPLLWEGFQRSTLVSSWRRYFQFSFAVDHKLDPAGRYVFAGFPHGVFPVSELLCISLLLKIWPSLRVYSICASSVFKVPVWRHILCWTGARPATAHDFRELLKLGSVSLVPGGIAEMFLWEEEREVIKARERKGFVRIAVAAGVPLVPVYHFGNSKLFSWVAPRSWEVLARRLRTAIGYPLGRWGTLLPRNAPLFMAVGSPIPVPRIAPGEPGYAEAVDAAHAELVKALEELYHKYKRFYGWEDRPLIVN